MNEIVESSSPVHVRRCANIKGRNTPDVQCNLTATYGDFCSRHWKHPRFYSPYNNIVPSTYSPKELHPIKIIQAFWRKHRFHVKYRLQGPGVFCMEMSRNDTDLYTLDPINTIPPLYYFSFIDSSNCLWSFDIRTLGHLLSVGELKTNPYTRKPLTDGILARIRNRLTWLRTRKYTVFYPIGLDLTSEQIWKQTILDSFMKIESHGFYVSCDWFSEMSIDDHIKFYSTLYSIWFDRLGLTHADREKIMPQYLSAQKKLFKYNTDSIKAQQKRTGHWWQKLNLSLIEAFLTRSTDNKLGAMYCVMGLVAVNEKAAEVFPWLI